ncbi:MAG: HAD-IC family P-type ATPase [Pseudomonadota bacterium]
MTLQGLAAQEAERRLLEYGPNAVAEETPRLLRRVLKRFWEPVPWMLEAAIVLQLALGERVEALVIAALLVFNVILGLMQEQRAGTALAALKSKLALRASVLRDGRWERRPAADIVPGDIVKLSLGGVVPADVRIVDGAILLDQSMLTGESVAVEAAPGALAYAGAIVRRGEALAEVAATGSRTYFGRTAELVRVAHAQSSEQRAVLDVVRDIAAVNGAIVVLLVAYTHVAGIALERVIPLVLTAILASIPVALPATFTLAAALGAQALAAKGVLLTRLSAVHDMATMDTLCSDKTGTLTRNLLSVAAVAPMPGHSREQVLTLAAMASSEGGADPLDAAIRAAAPSDPASAAPGAARRFIPFDPATKTAEAMFTAPDGTATQVVKGAYAAVAARSQAAEPAGAAAEELQRQGQRVLAVAAGSPPAPLDIVGLIGLSDPPRADSAPLIAEMKELGVRTIMITGDAPGTAAAVARAVGLQGPIRDAAHIPADVRPEDFAVYAGVLPEHKYKLVKSFQAHGHSVGMCGDGANDAPALRQANFGIAVVTATDVAKSAASAVLTGAGLGGIVDAIKEGRIIYQRVLTYTLNALIKKVELVPLLALWLIGTGQAILTPMLMVLLLVTGDFLTMAIATDRTHPSARPDAWRVGRITAAAILLGLCKLFFSILTITVGSRAFGLDADQLRTLAFVTLVFGGQAVVYAIRERGPLWRSRPSPWLILASALDLGLAAVLAGAGFLMAALPPTLLLATFAAAAVFSILLDLVKVPTLRRLGVG